MTPFAIYVSDITNSQSPYYEIDTDALVYGLGFVYVADHNGNGPAYVLYDYDDVNGNGTPDLLEEFLGVFVSEKPSQGTIGG
ncbi:MAG: hypothetical protein K6G56_03790 [Clostridiales bacterium]|nr:hypothetical protein [Clostridiales bacterium]